MEQNSIWIIGIAALAVGALIGYFLGRAGSDAAQRQALERQLDDTRQELADYKQQVGGHFEKTAELVNQLTDTYRNVHQHLASGARSLCDNASASIALQTMLQPKLEASTEAEAAIPVVTEVVPGERVEEIPEPPRDYATKPADEEGTLSEKFGLKSDESEEDIRDAAALAELKRKQKAAAEEIG